MVCRVLVDKVILALVFFAYIPHFLVKISIHEPHGLSICFQLYTTFKVSKEVVEVFQLHRPVSMALFLLEGFGK